MKAVGVDLSGPSNAGDTAVVILTSAGERLRHIGSMQGAADDRIFESVSDLAGNDLVVVGLDAPLSYNIGGGDREADTELRSRIKQHDMPPGSVMAPTAPRMVYLTLRGLALSRALDTIGTPRVKVVEVHPGATLALRGARIEHIRNMKHDVGSRMSLLKWLEGHGLEGVAAAQNPSDHYVAACAAALAAWSWHINRPVWVATARPPHYPYDFAC